MPTTILLSEYNLTIKQGKNEQVIPYAGISEVVLNKSGDRVYRTELLPQGGKAVVITNKYHTTGRNAEDRSRAYSTFVRVLHFHLKDKSKAHFVSGSSPKAIWLWTIAAAALGFAVSQVLGVFGLVLVSRLADGILTGALFAALVLASRVGRLPKSYLPSDIPLDFLP